MVFFNKTENALKVVVKDFEKLQKTYKLDLKYILLLLLVYIKQKNIENFN